MINSAINPLVRTISIAELAELERELNARAESMRARCEEILQAEICASDTHPPAVSRYSEKV